MSQISGGLCPSVPSFEAWAKRYRNWSDSPALMYEALLPYLEMDHPA
eukprot:CAMPEP_0198592038 /NCGR_PEP_ID=MMETSP1462-20131121/137639_1 /TAXON_ID=1333877 /ORGANISM="Brandtodinium nutriculum, Strain RCC3387" /LENGTH=46 /DNA_ID= /DNA_START= /DNA_END= /DNA_ORIENTATION=